MSTNKRLYVLNSQAVDDVLLLNLLMSRDALRIYLRTHALSNKLRSNDD